MSVKLTTKQKAKAKTAAPGFIVPPELVTELIRLHDLVKAELDKIAPLEQLFKQTKDQVIAHVEATTNNDDKVTLVETDGRKVTVSARRREVQTIDKEGIADALPEEALAELIQFPIGELKKYLSENELAKFLTYAYTGPRSVKVE